MKTHVERLFDLSSFLKCSQPMSSFYLPFTSSNLISVKHESFRNTRSPNQVFYQLAGQVLAKLFGPSPKTLVKGFLPQRHVFLVDICGRTRVELDGDAAVRPHIFISLTDFQNANPFPENNAGYLMTPCFSSGRPSNNDKFQTFMFIHMYIKLSLITYIYI